MDFLPPGKKIVDAFRVVDLSFENLEMFFERVCYKGKNTLLRDREPLCCDKHEQAASMVYRLKGSEFKDL